RRRRRPGLRRGTGSSEAASGGRRAAGAVLVEFRFAVSVVLGGTDRNLRSPSPARPFVDLAPPTPPPRWRLLAAYAAVYLVWGSTYLGIRFAVETIPPLLMAGFRFVVAGSVLYGVLRLRGAQRPSGRQWAGAALVGALMVAV